MFSPTTTTTTTTTNSDVGSVLNSNIHILHLSQERLYQIQTFHYFLNWGARNPNGTDRQTSGLQQSITKYLNWIICELITNLPDSMLMPALHSLFVLSLYGASDSPISAS